MCKARHIVAGFALLLSSLNLAIAQDYRGTLQGIVTDSTQAVLVDASVTLTNIATGVVAVQNTGAQGQYRFGFVEPGTYRVSAALPGFGTVIQNDVQVQTLGDVTVNITLRPGDQAQSVTVMASVVELQFDTTTKDLTLSTQQIENLPIQDRSPYSLALLDPAVQNAYPAAATPFHMWQASEMDFGGRTSRENDVLIDGTPVQVGPKGSYTPTMDGTEEMVVEQVAVDAEYGHTAGGVINISTRSGTNQFHGTADYYGRNPDLNAATNALTHQASVVRNNIWGGTFGGPVKKNKVFSFFAYEGWKTASPYTVTETLPTALERTGDFSKSLNIDGTLRTIYDPFTTQYNPVSGVVTRTPFPNNVIPASLLDPTAAKMMADIWQPNAAPSNIAGANNFRKTLGLNTNYWNVSDRTDWNVSDKLKIFGRYSQFSATNGLPDYTGSNSPAELNGQSGIMASRNIAADAVYVINSTTVADLRFGYVSFRDNSGVPQNVVGSAGLASLWPNNNWYQPYIGQYGGNVYFPSLNIGGNSFGVGSLYYQQPQSYNVTGKIAKTWGRHNLKAGLESRYESAFISYPGLTNFAFGAATTSSTFINPQISLSGDPYATFLLGAPNDGSSSSFVAPGQISLHYYGTYLQDDFKLNSRITLNLGLRYEYESAPVDAQNRYTRYLNLTAANPVLQANPPPYTAADIALRQQYLGPSAGTPLPNGQWLFASGSSPSQFNAPKWNFEPRAGIAFRLNDKTAILAGYGRFLVLNSQVGDGLLARPSFVGYSGTTSILPSQQGVPVTALSNPFPATNPLQPVLGATLGVNTNLGNGYGNPYGGGFRDQNYKDGVLDRFNVTVERELPAKFRLDVSFVFTDGRNMDSNAWYDSFPINNSNPALYYNTLQGQMFQQVPNPFYQYLTAAQFPGSLRNQKTIPLYQLLRPYPQYGNLYTASVPIEGDIVKNFEVRVQRAYGSGFTLLASYLYNHERSTWFPSAGDFTDGSYYYNQKPAWTTGSNPSYPQNRAILSGLYDLPFGRNRQFLTHANAIVDGILGGWSTGAIINITSGMPMTFSNGNPYVVVSDPTKDVPAGYAFNPNAFANLPQFAPFTGPEAFAGANGPITWNIDASLAKSFHLTERLKLQFRAEAYNLTNGIQWAPADANYGDSTFGQVNLQQANVGRTVQYSLRLSF